MPHERCGPVNRRHYGTIRVLTLAGALLALNACAMLAGSPENIADNAQTIAALNSSIAADEVIYQKEEAKGSTDPSKLKSLRNQVAFDQIQLSEIYFTRFQDRLWGDNNVVSTGGDLALLILNGLGATTGNSGTKAALAAASAGIVGAKGAISKDIYFQRTLPAMLAQMSANRDNEEAAIISNLNTKDDSSYPLSLVEIDLQRLQRASGMAGSVQSVTETAANNQSSASEHLSDTIRTGTFSTSSSAQRLEAWIGFGPGRVFNRTNFNALQAWVTKNDPDIPVMNLLDDAKNSTATEAARNSAIAALGLP